MREKLRQATGRIHARLDKTVGHMPVSSLRDYGRFLAAQYTARSEVERALQSQPPAGLGTPPILTDALARDLDDLGIEPARSENFLCLETPSAALGAAWVLAGSSLGNRAMLTRRRKADEGGPERFLADKGLANYFDEVLAVLARPQTDEEVDQAISGALAAFAVFERAFAAMQSEQAA